MTHVCVQWQVPVHSVMKLSNPQKLSTQHFTIPEVTNAWQ